MHFGQSGHCLNTMPSALDQQPGDFRASLSMTSSGFNLRPANSRVNPATAGCHLRITPRLWRLLEHSRL